MLRSLILRWLVIFLAVLIAGALLPNQIGYGTLGGVALFAFVLALLNALIRPFLVLVTCPITLLTLGLFTLVINAMLFWLAAGLTGAVTVEGFGGAFLGALVVSVVSVIMNWVLR